MKAVFTGGPCVGKSTAVRTLADCGYPVVNEIATEVIQSGGPLPWVDHVAFQHEVVRRQDAAERQTNRLPGWKIYDRGMPDGMAYRMIQGLPIPEFFKQVTQPRRYDVCFLFEPLEHWTDDGVRYEDPDFTKDITPILERVYQDQGVPVVRVRNAPVPERLNLIVSTLNTVQARNYYSSGTQTTTTTRKGGASCRSHSTTVLTPSGLSLEVVR